MATDEKTAARSSVATVVATAAVTLAIGVTVAALGGYLVPASDGARTTPEQVIGTTAVEAQRAAPPSDPSVILVLVVPDPRAEPPAPDPSEPPEVLFAAYEPTANDDERRDEHRDKHRDKRHEDDHDGDD